MAATGKELSADNNLATYGSGRIESDVRVYDRDLVSTSPFTRFVNCREPSNHKSVYVVGVHFNLKELPRRALTQAVGGFSTTVHSVSGCGGAPARTCHPTSDLLSLSLEVGRERRRFADSAVAAMAAGARKGSPTSSIALAVLTCPLSNQRFLPKLSDPRPIPVSNTSEVDHGHSKLADPVVVWRISLVAVGKAQAPFWVLPGPKVLLEMMWASGWRECVARCLPESS